MAQVGIRCGRWGSEKGAQLVEFALVLPLLLLVVIGIAEFGFVFQRYEVLTNAAREGARIAVLPGYVTDDVRARITNYLDAGGVPNTTTNPAVSVTTQEIELTPGVEVETRTVTLTYTYNIQFLSGIGSWFGVSYSTLPMSAASQMRVEATFVP